MIKRRKSYVFAVSFLLFEMVMVLITSGCNQSICNQLGYPVPGADAELYCMYEAAVVAYQAGDYRGATQAFDYIRGHSENSILVRKSLFGLACAAIMAADSQEDLIQATTYWQNWVDHAPEQWDTENPLLFRPLIDQRISVPEAAVEGALESNSNHLQANATILPAQKPLTAANLKTELEQTKKQLAKVTGQLSEKQTTIDTLSKELGKLKEQLKAIELIDQKIQEKKKAIPTTE